MVVDPYENRIDSMSDPASRHFAITPGTDFPFVTREIYCGDAGNIEIRDTFGEVVSYTVPAGMRIPIRANLVVSGPGTTVTNIVGWV